MKKLVSVLYTASILLGSFCPMTLAVAMQPSQPMEHVAELEEVLMSPYIPMTLAAPMSVAPVVSRQFLSTAQAPGDCPGGNCITVDHAQKQEMIVPVATGDPQEGAALPAPAPTVAVALSLPLLLRHAGGSPVADTIATVVLRV